MNNNLFDIPRTLIVSNNCLSASSANGRTMMNFFRDAAPGKLAQFYISGTPEPGFPCQFFQVSDSDALRALLPFCYHREPVRDAEKPKTQSTTPVRSCRNLFFRDLVWRTGCWKRKKYRSFLRSFSPQVVLLQAGDAPFMYRIARQISWQFCVPLVIYNSEGYVLKRVLYAGASATDPWHKLFRSVLLRAFDKAMRSASYCVYSTEYLEDCYRRFRPDGPESVTLYTVSDLPAMPVSNPEPFTLLYCGNLRAGRSEALNEIAEVLDKTEPPVRLDIYGVFPTSELEAMLKAHPCVRCHGVIPYKEISEKMEACTMLLHCEKDDRVQNLAHAFSTKIADSLASGKPFLVCAKEEYPFVKYLKKHNCAHIVSAPKELPACLKACLAPEYLNRYRDAALRLAAENHSYQKNAAVMARILRNVCEKRD